MNFDDLLGVVNIDETEPVVPAGIPEGHQNPPQNLLNEQPSDSEKKDVRDMYGAQFKAQYVK